MSIDRSEVRGYLQVILAMASNISDFYSSFLERYPIGSKLVESTSVRKTLNHTKNSTKGDDKNGIVIHVDYVDRKSSAEPKTSLYVHYQMLNFPDVITESAFPATDYDSRARFDRRDAFHVAPEEHFLHTLDRSVLVLTVLTNATGSRGPVRFGGRGGTARGRACRDAGVGAPVPPRVCPAVGRPPRRRGPRRVSGLCRVPPRGGHDGGGRCQRVCAPAVLF